MRKWGIIAAGIVTMLVAIFFLPAFVIYLIGCYQIGSFIGGWMSDKLEEED